jgi:hypothetical protein
MYRLCLTSAVLLALGAGASFAQGTSTLAADPVESTGSAASTALGSSSSVDSPVTPNSERSPAVENGAQSARATERSKRLHRTVAPAKTVETAPSTVDNAPSTDEVTVTKTVEIKDTGERTKCEDIGLPGSRMVVGKRCYTYNIHDRTDMKLADQKKEQTKQTVQDLRRMQDNLERQQRQQEWNRERAAAALVMGTH